MRWTVFILGATVAIGLSSMGHFTAQAQIGGAAPGRTRSGVGGTTTPEPRFGGGAASGGASGSTSPGSGGAFPLPGSTPPATIPPPTTPPPVRGPGGVSDSTIDPPAADAGGFPRFGSPPPTTDRSLPPSTLPGRTPSTLGDPAFDPRGPASSTDAFGRPSDPLEDRGSGASGSGAMPLDDDRTLPGGAGAGRDSGSALPSPDRGSDAPAASDRRLAKMIYHNELGTFFLVLDQGSALYHLQHQQPTGPQSQAQPQAQPCLDGGTSPGSGYVQHLATLQFEESNDGNYWHYTTRDGDQFTSEWAFAQRPSRDGGYAVYRQTRGGWARYGSFSRQAVR
jgi:hypothetical protein